MRVCENLMSCRWALSKIEMHVSIFIVANIYVFACLSFPRRVIRDEGESYRRIFPHENGKPTCDFSSSRHKGERAEGERKLYMGETWWNLPSKGQISPFAKIVICRRNCFPLMFRPNLVVATKGLRQLLLRLLRAFNRQNCISREMIVMESSCVD